MNYAVTKNSMHVKCKNRPKKRKLCNFETESETTKSYRQILTFPISTNKVSQAAMHHCRIQNNTCGGFLDNLV